MRDLVTENDKMLTFVQHNQEYNPTPEVDDLIVQNIANAMEDYR